MNSFPAGFGGGERIAPTTMHKARNTTSLVRQTMLYGLGTLGPAIVAAASTATFTRIFRANEYGTFTVATAVVMLASAFVVQVLQQPLARYMPGANKLDARRMLRGAWLGLGLLTLLTATAALLVPGDELLESSEYRGFWLPGILVFWLQLIFACGAVVLQARMDARFYSSQQVWLSVYRFAGSLILVYAVLHDSTVLMWGSALALMLVLPPVLLRSGMLAALRPGVRMMASRESWRALAGMSAYGVPMVCWAAASNVVAMGDRIVIGAYRGSHEAGIYGSNYNLITSTLGLVTAPVLAACGPFLMKSWTDGDERATAYWIGRIVSGLLAAGVLLIGATSLLFRDIAALVLGPDFREGAAIMPVVVSGMALMSVAMYAHKPFELRHRLRGMVVPIVVAAASNIALNVMLVPAYGYRAAAWVAVACYLLYTLWTAVAGRRLLAWRCDWMVVLVAAAAALAGYAGGSHVLGVVHSGHPVIRLFAGTAAYGGIAFLIVGLVYRERLTSLGKAFAGPAKRTAEDTAA